MAPHTLVYDSENSNFSLLFPVVCLYRDKQLYSTVHRRGGAGVGWTLVSLCVCLCYRVSCLLTKLLEDNVFVYFSIHKQKHPDLHCRETT